LERIIDGICKDNECYDEAAEAVKPLMQYAARAALTEAKARGVPCVRATTGVSISDSFFAVPVSALDELAEQPERPRKVLDDVARHIHAHGPYLPPHWRYWLERNPQAVDPRQFVYVVALAFEDGSCVTFQNAIGVSDLWRKELLVMTEHCGYHVFGLVGVDWSMLGRVPRYDANRDSCQPPRFNERNEPVQESEGK
jgi:hypothetical protein